jgi:hypothetical protein
MRPGKLVALAVGLGLSLAAGAAQPAEQHWAFQPPVRPPLPRVRDAAWASTPIDSFILARLEQAGLTPARLADRATLLRRVTFDLIGLPPTPEELTAFLEDTRPDAYVRVVERLLSSPHHGERWAQHWLDVVRYAETNGYEADGLRPDAWRYRDYVIRSLNEDKPYDRFVQEQLAGDLLAGEGAGQTRAALLVAAGFNRCGPVHQTSGNIDPTVLRQEVLTEMTSAVGAAFLGLTLGCARCHDHKFDPVSQSDYYQIQAFFSLTQPKEIDLATPAERVRHDRQARELEVRIAPLRQQLARLEGPYRERLTAAKKARLEAPYREALATPPGKRTAEQKKLAGQAETLIKVTWDEIVDALTPADRRLRADLRRQMHDLEQQKPAPPAQAWTVADTAGQKFAHVLKRGDPGRPGPRVEPGFPAVLCSTGAEKARSANRLDLARWLTRPDHPLTARVIVNRLWQHHFGRGLVATPNDFGRHGEPPSHPELLDWLARELVDSGWSLRHLHRLMVLSSTYRQSSRRSDTDPRARTLDPENRLLGRMNRRRLDGEELRDSVLAVSGSLTRRLGGPMVRVPLEPEVYDLIFTEGEPDGLWPVTPDPLEHTRRSIYLFKKRNVRLPLLEAFDQPDTLTSCPARSVSTFAPQALILLNGPFLPEHARRLAARLLQNTPKPGAAPEPRMWIEDAYRLALGRPPRASEVRQAVDFLSTQADLLRDRLPVGLPNGVEPALSAALADFCLALLNRNEFVHVE